MQVSLIPTEAAPFSSQMEDLKLVDDWVNTATWGIIHKLKGENTKQSSPVIHIRVLVCDL